MKRRNSFNYNNNKQSKNTNSIETFDLYEKEIQESNNTNLKDFVPKTCLKKYNQSKFIGSGKFGKVYQLCKNKQCNQVMKIIPIDENEIEESSFFKEGEIYELMGNYEIGPKVYDYFICPKILFNNKYTKAGIIIMEMLDMTLDEYVGKQLETIRNNEDEEDDDYKDYLIQLYNTQISKMYEIIMEKLDIMINISYNGKLGYKHTDIHIENIMVNIDVESTSIIDDVEDVFFIDFNIFEENNDDITYEEMKEVITSLFEDLYER